MANFDLCIALVVEGRFEALVADHHIAAGEEGHDSTLTDTGISDDQHCLGSFLVNGDGLQSIVDKCLELGQVDWVRFVAHQFKL